MNLLKLNLYDSFYHQSYIASEYLFKFNNSSLISVHKSQNIFRLLPVVLSQHYKFIHNEYK